MRLGAAQFGGDMESLKAPRTLVAVVLGAALLTVVGSALAAGGKGPARATVVVTGSESMKPNAFLTNTFHFQSGTVPIRSGGTITITNTTRDGHTLSLVKSSQVPRSIKQIENCRVCGEVAKSHGINTEGPASGPPPIRLVDVGAPGFDSPGDSIIIPPKGRGGPVTFKVTARPGTILNFMCVFHPWMSGRFLVK
jgi:plastocyanin